MSADTRTEGEILEDELEYDVNVPWVYRWHRLSNYYGWAVREFLIASAVVMLLGAPFYATNMSVQLPFIVIGALVMVCVAALTSPNKQSILSIDAIVSGSALVIFEIWALNNFETDPLHAFLLRQIVAILSLCALYFSTKTLRAMIYHQIGTPHWHEDYVSSRFHDFREDNPKPMSQVHRLGDKRERNHMWNEDAKEALEELNDREKLEYND